DWMVVEADESDGSFLRLDGTIAVVTNIDPEHLDHYRSFDAVKDAFVQFIENVPFYGAALLCLDHPEVQAVLPRVRDRRIVTYGFSTQADVRGVNVVPIAGGNRFEAIVRHRDGTTRSIEHIDLPMAGRHNVQNALAAIGVALELGIPDATIQRGFAKFGGVKRRFTKVGEIALDDGAVTIIDDYGHHPVEIRAVLSAARESVANRVIAVVQPHRYSRLGDLMEDFQQAFNDADIVYVTPVYAAGEAPVDGVGAESLVDGLKRRGHRAASTVASADELATALAGQIQPGDMVVCLGAGDITKWAAGLAEAVTTRRQEVPA
uniref:UDP-N-acetylmuramate--L-alanine ligase n=1 Tax=uncultured Sphingomonas sp. TaxID=158754 RepID=UPI0035C9B70B